jgi:hypothetical protein
VQVLRKLGVPEGQLATSMIEVWNKADLLPQQAQHAGAQAAAQAGDHGQHGERAGRKAQEAGALEEATRPEVERVLEDIREEMLRADEEAAGTWGARRGGGVSGSSSSGSSSSGDGSSAAVVWGQEGAISREMPTRLLVSVKAREGLGRVLLEVERKVSWPQH